MNIKKIFLFLLLFLSIFNITESSDFKVIKPEIKIEEQDVIKEEIVFLNFFERKNCIHCKSELTFLENLENQSFYLNRLDLDDKNNLELFNQIINKYGLSAATPLNLIGDSIIVGFDNSQNTGKQILEKIKEARENNRFNLNIDYYLNSKEDKNLNNDAPSCDESGAESCILPESEIPKIEIEKKENVSIFGLDISIKDMSLFTLSSILGFIDGFNPCAMWVLLTFLIALSQIGDRKKMAIIAGLFILAEGIMYYLILVFWSSAWKIMPNKDLMTLIIGLFAIIAGLYFLYKWWKNRNKFTCDTTGTEHQNKISSKISELSKKPLNIITIISVLALAFSVNVIEVACSLGIPQTFTATLAVNNLSFLVEQFYITIYTLFYMLDDLIVFGLALWGYKKFYQFGAKYSKLSTLFAGVLILALGIMLAFFPATLVF